MSCVTFFLTFNIHYLMTVDDVGKKEREEKNKDD